MYKNEARYITTHGLPDANIIRRWISPGQKIRNPTKETANCIAMKIAGLKGRLNT